MDGLSDHAADHMRGSGDMADSPRRGRIMTSAQLEERARDRGVKAKADAIFAKAREEGYAEGRDKASTEAIAMIARLRIDTQRWVRSIEVEMVDVVMRSVAQIIGEVDDLELVQRVSAVALSELRDVGRVSLHVAPKDYASVRDHIAILAQAFPSIEIADVAPDNEVTPGGAVLRSPIGSIDARLETQLEGLRLALSDAFAPVEEEQTS
jgi:type III secretion protein L